MPHKSAIGVSSFAFRYGAGFPGCVPRSPMTGAECIAAAADMGFACIQLCENLGFAALDSGALSSWATLAGERNIRTEIGMNGLDAAGIRRHLDICSLFGADFLRLVIGAEHAGRPLRCLAGVIREVLPDLRSLGVTLGIENHFDLTTREIRDLIDMADDPAVGAVYDTTNALGFLELPAETLAILGPRIVSVHMKDYVIRKAEAGYFITGAVLGTGLLPAAEIAAAAAAHNPRVRFLIEMTIRRRDGISADEAAEEERPQTAASAAYLRSLFD